MTSEWPKRPIIPSEDATKKIGRPRGEPIGLRRLQQIIGAGTRGFRQDGASPNRAGAVLFGPISSGRLFRGKEVHPMLTTNVVILQPLVALIAGILILVMPRLLNYIVAIYLIIIGLAGLLPHLGR
ncbi:MAG TPA: DUF3096 domain-containing protein [Stellaceae bacterium]|nr:DUF3096 domain-containing protein [Stellaceae bacterium]